MSDRLLVLDIDETLLHAAESPLPHRSHDFSFGPYLIHKRPHLDQFIREVYELFQVAYWSSASPDYVTCLVEIINPPELTPQFVWARDRCTIAYHPELQENYFVKDLKKVKRRGYDLQKVLIVDDTPSKSSRNYGNAIYIPPFMGETNDVELLRLAGYLRRLRTASNYRSIEKRYWRLDLPWHQ